jgi:nitroreductase
MKDQLAAAAAQGVRIPRAANIYYEKIAPMMYTLGFLGLFGILKKVFFFFMGFVKPVPREPFSKAAMTTWATKTTALACQNFMLAMRAAGFDTCPMEGMDSRRVKKLLQLPSDATVAMVIACGKRKPEGVTLPQIRGPRNWFINEI